MASQIIVRSRPIGSLSIDDSVIDTGVASSSRMSPSLSVLREVGSSVRSCATLAPPCFTNVSATRARDALGLAIATSVEKNAPVLPSARCRATLPPVTVIVSVPTLPAASVADTVMTFAPGSTRTTGIIQRVVPRAVPLPPQSLVHVTTASSETVPTSGMKCVLASSVGSAVGAVIVMVGTVPTVYAQSIDPTLPATSDALRLMVREPALVVSAGAEAVGDAGPDVASVTVASTTAPAWFTGKRGAGDGHVSTGGAESTRNAALTGVLTWPAASIAAA